MLLELTTGIPSFLIWLRPSDNLLATVSSCHQQWLMNCDILLLSLSFSLSLPLSFSFSVSRSLFTSRSIDYWNTLRSLPFLTRPRSFSLSLSLSLSLCPFHLPVCLARSLSSPRSPLSCTIHLANLIFGVDRALNGGLCFHIHLSPSPDLSFLPSFLLSPSFSFPSSSLFQCSDNEIRLQPFICISGICGSKRD